MVPIPKTFNCLIVLVHSLIVSPPQNCLKMVAFITPFIGRCALNEALVAHFPNLTIEGLPTILKSQYALLRSLSDLLLKAISVFSKETILQK